jgi:hypothetical protein
MQAKYEDGREAQIGDAGMFTYGDNVGGGYRYDGIVTKISETGRLEIRTIEDYPVALIMADQVIFEPVKPQDVGPQVWPVK